MNRTDMGGDAIDMDDICQDRTPAIAMSYDPGAADDCDILADSDVELDEASDVLHLDSITMHLNSVTPYGQPLTPQPVASSSDEVSEMVTPPAVVLTGDSQAATPLPSMVDQAAPTIAPYAPGSYAPPPYVAPAPVPVQQPKAHRLSFSLSVRTLAIVTLGSMAAGVLTTVTSLELGAPAPLVQLLCECDSMLRSSWFGGRQRPVPEVLPLTRPAEPKVKRDKTPAPSPNARYRARSTSRGRYAGWIDPFADR